MTDDRSGVKSLNVALDVIEAVAAAEDEVGVTEVAKRLGLTKAKVFRHLQTLVERNYLAQNARTSRYRLGVQCQLMAQLSSNQTDLRSACDDAAHWLREQTGLSVVVSAIRARSVVVLSTLPAKTPVQIGVRPGSELSLHHSAQGRAALAFGSSTLLSFARTGDWQPLTPYTTRTWEELDEKIAGARKRGWADAPEELALGLNAVAAPVFDNGGTCVATLAVVGLIQTLPRDVDPQIVAALCAAARRASARLGFHPPDHHTGDTTP